MRSAQSTRVQWNLRGPPIVVSPKTLTPPPNHPHQPPSHLTTLTPHGPSTQRRSSHTDSPLLQARAGAPPSLPRPPSSFLVFSYMTIGQTYNYWYLWQLMVKQQTSKSVRKESRSPQGVLGMLFLGHWIDWSLKIFVWLLPCWSLDSMHMYCQINMSIYAFFSYFAPEHFPSLYEEPSADKKL